MLAGDQPVDTPLSFTPLTLSLTPPTTIGAEGTFDVTLKVWLLDYLDDIVPLVIPIQIVV